jgi:hypothetical protein
MAMSGSTEVEIAPRFDRNWHRARAAMQVLLGLMVAGGLAGLFGDGPLSTGVTQIGVYRVSYQRFARRTVPFRISIRPLEPIPASTLQIGIDRQLIDRTGILRSVPASTFTSESVDEASYNFAVASGRRSEIVISVQPDQFGVFNWTLKIGGAGQATLFQVIYP